MKRNGFTLVELLASIAILAILFSIIAPIVTNLIGDNEDALHEQQIKNFVDAAKQYVVLNNELLDENANLYVYVSDLISAGVIDNDDVIDPKTKKSLTGCVVVSFNNSFNQYDYIYDSDC